MPRDLIKELDAKAWQSTRHRVRARSPQRREDHICYLAAREIERLSKIEDASQAEKGWRTFWQGMVEFLGLDKDQRTYGWHSLMDACEHGINRVKKNL